MTSYEYVSVVEPLTPAIERVKTILFRPFDLGKWFAIGFCAWLAHLGRGGGGGGGGGMPGGGSGGGSEIRNGFFHARDYVMANLPWIVPVAIVGFVLIVALWLLVVWLSSRGRFMFLHCVANNRAEVKVPWSKYERQANSLFVFRLILGVIGVFAVFGPIVFVGLLITGMVSAGQPAVGGIAGAVFIVLAIILISICLAVVVLFTGDFVEPIMLMRMTSCTAAWGEFVGILGANKGRFFLYVLFKIVIDMAIGVVVMLIVCATCCCAGCLLAIPYIGTVLALPLLVFKRAYPLYYLQQYGPQYDIFASEEQAPPQEPQGFV